MPVCRSGGCASGKGVVSPRSRKALRVAFVINALMFLVRVGSKTA